MVSLFLFIGIIIVLTVWTSSQFSFFGIPLHIDSSNLPANSIVIGQPSNNTVVVRDGSIIISKISLQSVPTIINGITASISIIIGFSGAAIGIMVREIFRNDKKARQYYLSILFLFIYAFAYQLWVYQMLISGDVDIALRWSLCGLLLSILIFGSVMIVAYYRIELQKEAVWESMDY